jgi:hypothetical protein
VQYIIHQGFTEYRATYWVGANALIRLQALRDVRTWAEERGHRVPIFIQDRTVIEDTGSTLDLIRRGWTLHNYPERLAYSAMPPDFGSLIIQRRRWSNGGLIIFADLVRYARPLQHARTRAVELLIRAYYLLSPAMANFALLMLLFYPFDMSITSVWLPVSAAPYYYLYGRDMVGSGYRWTDLPRVYALNLLLLPVNLAGVLRSLQRVITGRKSAFGRTPKVEGRTSVPALHVLIQCGVLVYLVAMLLADIVLHRFAHTVFCAMNIGFWLYAMLAFVGLRESWADVRAKFAQHKAALAAAPIVEPISVRRIGASDRRRRLQIQSAEKSRMNERDRGVHTRAVPPRLSEATPDPGTGDN